MHKKFESTLMNAPKSRILFSPAGTKALPLPLEVGVPSRAECQFTQGFSLFSLQHIKLVAESMKEEEKAP